MFRAGTMDQTAALVGCLAYAGLTIVISIIVAAWITIATVFVIRLLAIRYKIESPALPNFRSHWEGRVGHDDRC